MSRQQLIPGPDHPITVAPHEGRVVVRSGNTVVADTTRALDLDEASYPTVLYLPLEDVDSSVLRPSDTGSYCPFKGEASYYSLSVGGTEIPDAIWYYPQPYDAVGDIAGHVAFYAGKVDVEA
jgi:uncharacterized protein (DUF427 family)